MLVELKLPPGVYKNGTLYQAKGRYSDCNLVRWFEGTLRPVGGWAQIKDNGNPRQFLSVMGAARGAHSWGGNVNDKYLAIGTHTKLYARKGGEAALIDITPTGYVAGSADTVINLGYGGGAYGFDVYGVGRNDVQPTALATTTSMDNFGTFLVSVQTEDGRLMYWDTVAAKATPVVATAGTTPVQNKGVLVTDERFVFLLAAGNNRRRIAWSDQENLFNWNITATTQAGDFELQTAGEIMCAKRVRGQTLILTSTDAHVANYIGPPLVYGFERVGDGCGVISRNAAITADKFAMWMGETSFYSYDGFVKPVPCEVSDFVFGRISQSQKLKTWATHNPEYSELTWFYPAGSEVDSYVTYNYREGHWSVGSMSRTIGVSDEVYSRPIRVSADGFVYRHEVGYLYDGAMPFAETGPVELGVGEQVMMAKYIYPDEKTQGDVTASFSTKFYPNAPQYLYGPYSMANPTSVRFTGRQVQMRVTGVKNTDWRVGVPRLDVEPGGLR